jgi:ribose-phosphate pyrophosphokinase
VQGRPSSAPPPIELVGDIAGRDVVIVDDLIDTGFSLDRRVALLRERGAARIIAFATHGLFNGGALARITRGPISECIVTNTVPLRDDVAFAHTHKLTQLSVAPLLAEAMLRVQTGQSLAGLRVYDPATVDARYRDQE